MLGELLEDRQAGDIGTGQLNSTQRLAVIQPAEELSNFRFSHSLIIVDREVVIFDPVPRPFGQLRKVQSTYIFHAPVVIYNSGGVGSQRKFIMEIFADGIGPLLSVQAVINSVFVTGKVHGGDRIAVDHTVDQKGFFLCVPHKIALYGVVVIDFALLHLIHQGFCRPVDIESLHIITSFSNLFQPFHPGNRYLCGLLLSSNCALQLPSVRRLSLTSLWQRPPPGNKVPWLSSNDHLES